MKIYLWIWPCFYVVWHITYTSLVLLTKCLDNCAEQKKSNKRSLSSQVKSKEKEVSTYKYSHSMRCFSIYPWQTSSKKFLCVAKPVLYSSYLKLPLKTRHLQTAPIALQIQEDFTHMLVMETKLNISGYLAIKMEKSPFNLHKIKTLKKEIFFYKLPIWFTRRLMLTITVLVESILISDTIPFYYIYIYKHDF